MADTPLSRRDLLERSGFAAAGAGLVTGGFTGTAAGFAKNETVHVGVIGAGGRVGFGLSPKLAKIPGVKLVAVCDIYQPHLDRAKKLAKDTSGHDPFVTTRHEELLAQKDVDAVIIGTPDHWHAPISIDALNAGKDVYCEKPLTHSMDEGQRILQAQANHRRVFQVGTQQRSMPQFIEARKLIQEGKLGPVHKIHMSWNRNHTPFRKRVRDINPAHVDWDRFLGSAPKQPFDPYRMIGNWRWFWDFGGGILTDLMVHWLDAVNFLLDLPMPTTATTMGDQYATQGVWETPDTIQTLLNYPKQRLQLHFEGTFVNQHEKAGVTLMGQDATLYLDRGRYELRPEPRRSFAPSKMVVGAAPPGADFDPGLDADTLHLANWIECIRTRKPAAAPAEAGVLAAAGAHLGNMAFKKKAVVNWQGS